MKKLSILFALLILLASLSACGLKSETAFDRTGTTCANAVMIQGKFAWSNDFIYINAGGEFYEFDLTTGTAVKLTEENMYWPRSLFATDRYLYWVGRGTETDEEGRTTDCLQYMTKDGKKSNVFWNSGDSCYYLYAEGTELFYTTGVGGALCCQKLPADDEEMPEPTVLLPCINQYYVDDNYIYAVIPANAEENIPENYLVRSPRQAINFEKIELSFPPAAVMADGDDLYIASQKPFQLTRWQEGTETQLPIRSVYYQVLNSEIIYLDDETLNQGTFTLKSYDLQTGEICPLLEGVYDFCILENRYICAQCAGEKAARYLCLDRQSGQLVTMLDEGERE